ncbi:unnamed protein product [Rotaria sordida]|uniref:Uncharacterized protein n=1 Tax=Rotaria sordida TaxID=392033 RepID=A0A818UWS3_9BILA|nr:unnamed protein product [Rotaria sordida]
MSSNNITIIKTSGPSTESLIAAYYSLTLIIVSTIFNITAFIILCRSTFRNIRARLTPHSMRAMTIIETLMLYG